MSTETLLKFPCVFPIKVIGKNSTEFVTDVFRMTQHHFPDFTLDGMTQRPSKNSRYIAITITVYAQDQETLNKLYQALSGHPDSEMVL